MPDQAAELAGRAVPRPARRRRQRRQRRWLVAGGGVAAVLAAVLAGTLILHPGARDVASPGPAPPADSVGSLRLGNVRMRPVIHHAFLKVGDEVTVDGQHFWLRRPTEFLHAIALCGGGSTPYLSESCDGGPLLRAGTSVQANPATFPAAGSQAPMVVVGLTSLRPTYGLLYNRTGRATIHTAQTPIGQVYWGVLPRERQPKPAESGSVPYDPDTVMLRMVSTDQSKHITGSVCLPAVLHLHCPVALA